MRVPHAALRVLKIGAIRSPDEKSASVIWGKKKKNIASDLPLWDESSDLLGSPKDK